MNDAEYWKEAFEKAMEELEKSQVLMKEMYVTLRELEMKLLGGSTK